MGAGLVVRALDGAAGAGLGHAATRLLVAMAVHALDTDTPPVSFLGRDAQADALGLQGTDQQRNDGLKRPIRQLKSTGLISLNNNPHTGRQAEYALHLPKRGDILYPQSEKEGGHSVRTGGTSRPERGDILSREGVPNVPPKEEEDKEGGGEEETPTPTSAFCSRHPEGTDSPCWGCKNARTAFEAKKLEEYVTPSSRFAALYEGKRMASDVINDPVYQDNSDTWGKSPFCKDHPSGTNKSCGACKTMREAFTEAQERILKAGPFCKTHPRGTSLPCLVCDKAAEQYAKASSTPDRRIEVRDGILFVNGTPRIGGARGMTLEQYDEWRERPFVIPEGGIK